MTARSRRQPAPAAVPADAPPANDDGASEPTARPRRTPPEMRPFIVAMARLLLADLARRPPGAGER
jgi:hypothetical protein